MTPQERGRIGGLVTASRHGRAYMAEIGGRGFAAYAAAHHGGNKAAARRALRLDGQRRLNLPDPPYWAVWREERGK